MKRRIGLMGGTFDPIHLGHLIAAERVLEEMQLDEIRFLPVYRPPHKTAKQGASPEERRELVELAIQDNPAFKLEPIELERGGISYSVDTVAALKERDPESELYWIIGGDMVQYLPQWHQVEAIVRQVTFVGLTRPGFPVGKESVPAWLREKVVFAEMPAIDISSTDIRARIKRGKSIRYLVTEAVRRRIEERGLYANGEHES